MVRHDPIMMPLDVFLILQGVDRGKMTNKLELVNCAGCGKMFRQEGLAVRWCPDCLEEHEQLLRKVKDVIRENPGLNVKEVSEKTGVSYSLILDWINEGRLER